MDAGGAASIASGENGEHNMARHLQILVSVAKYGTKLAFHRSPLCRIYSNQPGSLPNSSPEAELRPEETG